MPTPRKGPRLGKDPAHQRLMLANLAASLFEAGHLVTTETKAKVLRPYAERLITKAKRGGVHDRRQVVATIHDKRATHRLFSDIAPRYHVPARRLRPHPQARASPGRQCAHGAHRARLTQGLPCPRRSRSRPKGRRRRSRP